MEITPLPPVVHMSHILGHREMVCAKTVSSGSGMILYTWQLHSRMSRSAVKDGWHISDQVLLRREFAAPGLNANDGILRTCVPLALVDEHLREKKH